MAFKVRKIDHRPWPVTVRFKVCDDAGKVAEVEQSFVGHFLSFSEEEHGAVVDAVKQALPGPEDNGDIPFALVLQRNALYFEKLMCGWGPEVTDEADRPLPFSPAALKAMVTGPDGAAISDGLSRAIGELRFGMAPQGNLSTSPAPGEGSGAGEALTN